MPETTKATPRMLTVEQKISLSRPRSQVFEAITDGVDHWWAYRGKPDARMTLEPRPGGRFFETSGAGGFLWSTVFEVRPPELIKLTDPFGSMPGGPVFSHWSVRLEEKGGGTELTLTHQMYGEFGDDMESCVMSGWGALLAGLSDYVEKGKSCEVQAAC